MKVLGLAGGFGNMIEEPTRSWPEWFYHDASAALVDGSTVVAAVEEERLNRIKHTNKFPSFAARAVLETAGMGAPDIDHVAFFFDQAYTDHELTLQYLEDVPTLLLNSRELIKVRLAETFGPAIGNAPLTFVPHHLAHASLASYASPFEHSLVVVVDGNGEDESMSVYRARQSGLARLATVGVDDSLGHLYLEIIRLLGYRRFDEYKVMALASYGDRNRFRRLFDNYIDLDGEGRYQIRRHDLRNALLAAGVVPTPNRERWSREHIDTAAALQDCVERILLHVLSYWRQKTGERALCLVGGVAQNSAAVGVVCRSGLFEDVFVPSAAHDAGAALGAALHVAGGRPRPRLGRPMTPYLGPALEGGDDVESELQRWDGVLSGTQCKDLDELCEETAARIARDEIGAWAQGRSEFGPRALGNRSIVADPRSVDIRQRINDVIKKREGYRPLAPAVLAEDADRYFEVAAASSKPAAYMATVCRVRPEWRAKLRAVTHVDGTARLQIVDEQMNLRFHRLLMAVRRACGIPILINTSLNVGAEPISQTTRDVVTTFLVSTLDFVVVGDHIVTRRPEWRERLPTLRLRMPPTTVLRCDGTDPPVFSLVERHSRGRQLPCSPTVAAVLARASTSRTVTEALRQSGTSWEAVSQELLALWAARALNLQPL